MVQVGHQPEDANIDCLILIIKRTSRWARVSFSDPKENTGIEIILLKFAVVSLRVYRKPAFDFLFVKNSHKLHKRT